MKSYDDIPSDKDHGPIVLIVDDELPCHDRILFIAREANLPSNIQFLSATNLDEAHRLLRQYKPVQVMLLDNNLSWQEDGENQSGIATIPEFLEDQPQLEILVITSSSKTQDCVDAIRYGASDYVTKDELNEVIAKKIQRAIDVAALKLQNARLEGSQLPSESTNLAGKSAAMESYRKSIRAVAATEDTVLLLGGTGLGKTAGAKEIHRIRQEFLKQDGPFFALNVGAIPEALAEKLLFGNEKGAYTGADKVSLGYFELATKGTIFLDEIGEASPAIQAKLLTAIEEKIITRLGGEKERSFSAKIICATNRNLKEMVKQGTFREDLYYRIKSLTIPVPTLAERKEDIPDIVKALLPRCRTRSNAEVTFEELPPSFIHYLTETSFEGGIREILNYLKTLCVFAPEDKKGRPIFKKWKEILKIDHQPSASITLTTPISVKEIGLRGFDLSEVQNNTYRGWIDILSSNVMGAAFQQCGTLRKTSGFVGMHHTTLFGILKRLGLYKGQSRNSSRVNSTETKIEPQIKVKKTSERPLKLRGTYGG